MKVNRLVLGVVGAVLVAVMAIAFIPVPTPSPDFSRTSSSPEVRPSATASKPATVETVFRDTRWYELAPQDWDPYKQLRDMQKGMRFMPDTDPDGPAMLKKMREIWDNAPINSTMDGVTLPPKNVLHS
jgi:hypothetical protein